MVSIILLIYAATCFIIGYQLPRLNNFENKSPDFVRGLVITLVIVAVFCSTAGALLVFKRRSGYWLSCIALASVSAFIGFRLYQGFNLFFVGALILNIFSITALSLTKHKY
jgi:uncharacterized membrane protein